MLGTRDVSGPLGRAPSVPERTGAPAPVDHIGLSEPRAPIFYLATAGHTNGMRRLLASPSGRRLSGTVMPLIYEDVLTRMTRAFWWNMAKEAWWTFPAEHWSLFEADMRHVARRLTARLFRLLRARRRLPAGVYIFSDLELLSPADVRRATALWQELADSGRGLRLLNHPTRSMRRYELLRNLHERGINTFNVYRATEARWPRRYPVFLRFANDHGGARTPLLRAREELDHALLALERQGHGRDDILITEFCQTSDARGVYRKYGAFVVGDQVFPKNIQFSRSWVQKGPDLEDEEMRREELAYVETNPHAAELREIFRLARVDFGRMDYGLLDGRIQVWEINTNPHITRPASSRDGARRAIYEAVERRMTFELAELARRASRVEGEAGANREKRR